MKCGSVVGEEIVETAAEFEDRCSVEYSCFLRRMSVQILTTMISQLHVLHEESQEGMSKLLLNLNESEFASTSLRLRSSSPRSRMIAALMP